jgi:leucyl aminopeptidase
MDILITAASLPETGTVIVLQAEGGQIKTIPGDAEAVSRASKAASFTGKSGETMTILAPVGTKLDRLVVMGMGKADAFTPKVAEELGGAIVAMANGAKLTSVTLLGDGLPAGKETPSQLAAHVALGAGLRAYRFDQYRTTQKPDDKIVLEKLTLAVANEGEAKAHLDKLRATLVGVSLTRDLVSEPPNVLYPEVMAARSTEALQPLGVKCETLGVPEMTKLGMGSLLGVGMGSVREPKLLIMQYHGAGEGTAPVAFVGKGITFDTGGISLKPGPGMEEMKFDMAGGGAVIGLMATLAGRKAKVNAVGVVAIAENMPDGNAIRPGDVLTSMSGQTIEVHNTDAEGRLVLADALWYTNDRFKPQFMIDLATLTGACMVALGEEIGGMMSNNDELAAKLLAAGTETGETLWRLPLTEAFDKAIDSDIADMKNIAGNRYAGSSIGGQFLKRFVKDTPWAHLDIAGVAWTKKDKPTCPKGATAYGVRLLDRFVADNYETK